MRRRAAGRHLELEPGGRWYRMVENGRPIDDRRFLRSTLVDTESCTHTAALPGCRCP